MPLNTPYGCWPCQREADVRLDLDRTLAGGLRLLGQRRASGGVLSMRLWVAGGSARDPEGQRGRAQLMAGSLHRGAAGRSADAIAELFESHGASLRSEAGEDATVVALRLAADDAVLLGRALADLLLRPDFPEDQVGIERELTLRSLRRQKEDPFQTCMDQLRLMLYGRGGYGHDPMGLEADVAALSARNLREAHAQLGGDRAVLALAGEWPETLEDSLARLFGGWSVGSPGAGPPRHRGSEVVDHGAAEAIAGTGPPLQTASLSYGQAATEQVVLMMGVVALPLGHPDMPALRLLQCHLGVGMSARLFTTLREARGLAYDVGVYFPSRLAGAPFSCHMSSGTERAGEAVSALWEEWQRLLDQPLTGKELGLAKAKLAGQEAMGQMTTAQVSDRIALLAGHGLSHRYPEQTLDTVERLTGKDCLAAARRHLSDPRLAAVGPGTAERSVRQHWNRDRSAMDTGVARPTATAPAQQGSAGGPGTTSLC